MVMNFENVLNIFSNSKTDDLLKSKLALISLPHTATTTEVLMTSVVQKNDRLTLRVVKHAV